MGSKPEIEGDGEIDEDDDVDIAEFMGDDADEDGEDEGDVTFHGFEGDGDVEDDAVDGAEASDDDFDVAAFEDDDGDAFVGSDEELPNDIVIPEQAEEKGKGKDKKKRKRSLKSLPTFASVEDYAKLLGDDDEDL